MKTIWLLFMTLVCTASLHAQQVSAADLVSILEADKLPELSKWVRSMSYTVIDSSHLDEEILEYVAIDKKREGNQVSCLADGKLRITRIVFTTLNDTLDQRLKSELQTIGFKPESIRQLDLGKYIETQDFIRGKLLVITSLARESGTVRKHEFTFLAL